jgi:adenine-specific DNA-methyltransferase
MSRLTELISQIKSKDSQLGGDLEREFKALSSRREFGLNFERHSPEVVELPNRLIRKGDKVRVLPERGSTKKGDQQLWLVKNIKKTKKNGIAILESTGKEEPETIESNIDDLIVIAEFKDYIYPGLVSTGKVERGDNKPYHTVINGENYHALKALTFTHKGKLDAIYIDPPYNSGARDWKYNNDYVETEDNYRHSKWLAFMERRLIIAKELLNPDDSVLIVTIDEKEYLRLGMLLEQLFSEANIQMVTSVISPFGVARPNELSRVEEYIYYVAFGSAKLGAPNDSRVLLAREDDQDADSDKNNSNETFWFSLMRAGSNSSRRRSPGCFYPIYTNKDGAFDSVGDAISRGMDRNEVEHPIDLVPNWPINQNGDEAVWQVSPVNAISLFEKGFARTGRYSKKLSRFSITYLREGTISRLSSGDLKFNQSGKIDVIKESTNSGRTVWAFSSHNATSHGTKLLKKILPDRKFPYPKSLYAVEDTLRVYLQAKPNATVLDFFSGSGTTAHALMRLNKQDNGNRISISVTNNEVSADEQDDLRKKGLRPGDTEWERWGICDYITKPRINAAITGISSINKEVKGDYKYNDLFPVKDGLYENAEFFTLTYETPIAINYNLAFEHIAPLLWMRAGSKGHRIDEIAETGWSIADNYGVLFDPDKSSEFYKAIDTQSEIKIAYIVTDDDRRFQSIAKRLPKNVEPIRLYESYLKNFQFTSAL